jgi:hypothetical protein
LELDRHSEHSWGGLSELAQLEERRQPGDDVVKLMVERGLQTAAAAGL